MIRSFRDLDVYRLGFRLAMRIFPAAFVARLIDAEAEATETRVHIEFAYRCGLIAIDTARALDDRWDRTSAMLARMRAHPGAWHPDPARSPPTTPAAAAPPSGGGDEPRVARGSADARNHPASHSGSGDEPRVARPDADAQNHRPPPSSRGRTSPGPPANPPPPATP